MSVKNLHILIACAMAVFLLILSSCSSTGGYRSAEGGVWNTTYHITYRSGEDLHDSIRTVMKRVEMSLSPFADSSLISRINRGENVAADSMLRQVFRTSQRINRESRGVFDPTVAPLVNLWGFGYRNEGVEPTQEAIDSMLQTVGIGRCSLTPDGFVVRGHHDTEFNFSAITKGYGCDLVAEMLRRNGVEDYLVEIGGEIALAGRSPRGRDWRVMVDAPVDCDTAIVHERMAVIELADGGVATSGNYRNYKTTPEGRVWHTISPVTGRPAVTDILSATVIAPSCMEADAYATSCMAIGSAEALAIMDSIPGVEALVVTADTILRTSGFPTAR